MNMSVIPNLITFLRVFLILPFIYALVARYYDWALYTFLLAAVSDVLDGFLARIFHWESTVGGYLDPFADKLLMITSYFALAWLDLIPLWLMVLVIARDLLIMTGVIYLYILYGSVVMRPKAISKLNTFLQLLLVTILLFDLSFLVIPGQGIQVLIYGVASTTVLSMISYLRHGFYLQKFERL